LYSTKESGLQYIGPRSRPELQAKRKVRQEIINKMGEGDLLPNIYDLERFTQALRAYLVGALENLPAPGRSIQPQSSKIGRLETLPGPDSFLRVRSKQTLRLRYLWFWWKQDLNRP